MGGSTPVGCSIPGASDTYTDARSMSPIYKTVVAIDLWLRMTTNKFASYVNLLLTFGAGRASLYACIRSSLRTKLLCCPRDWRARRSSDGFLISLGFFLEHPGRVLAPLVFVTRVYSPLAWLHLVAEEVPDHARSIQTQPLDLVHQLFDLPSVFWSVCPADPILWYITNIAESCAVRLLLDVKPLLVPFR